MAKQVKKKKNQSNNKGAVSSEANIIKSLARRGCNILAEMCEYRWQKANSITSHPCLVGGWNEENLKEAA